MANVKTAISLEEELYKQAESMAHELNLSRSGLFAAALEEFIERRHNRRLLDSLNRAYADGIDDSERKYLRKMRRRHRSMIEDQW